MKGRCTLLVVVWLLAWPTLAWAEWAWVLWSKEDIMRPVFEAGQRWKLDSAFNSAQACLSRAEILARGTASSYRWDEYVRDVELGPAGNGTAVLLRLKGPWEGGTELIVFQCFPETIDPSRAAGSSAR